MPPTPRRAAFTTTFQEIHLRHVVRRFPLDNITQLYFERRRLAATPTFHAAAFALLTPPMPPACHQSSQLAAFDSRLHTYFISI